MLFNNIIVIHNQLQYSGSDTPVERINGTGPLRSDIYLHFLSVGNLNPPNIHYHFMDPLPQQQQHQFQQQRAATVEQVLKPPGSFYWRQLDQWSDVMILLEISSIQQNTILKFSLKCQGTQSQFLVCTDALANRAVQENHCAELRKPDVQKRMCNVDCFYKWQQRLNADSAGRRWWGRNLLRKYSNAIEGTRTFASVHSPMDAKSRQLTGNASRLAL